MLSYCTWLSDIYCEFIRLLTRLTPKLKKHSKLICIDLTVLLPAELDWLSNPSFSAEDALLLHQRTTEAADLIPEKSPLIR